MENIIKYFNTYCIIYSLGALYFDFFYGVPRLDHLLVQHLPVLAKY